MLAIIFYLIIEGGLVKVSFAINDFAIAAVSVIAGLMTNQAMKKLRDIFDALFGIKKTEKGDELGNPKGHANIKLGAQKNKMKKGEEMEIRADMTRNDGTYADNTELSFNIGNHNVTAFKDDRNRVNTDAKGLAFVIIKGISKGNTTITATSNIDGGNKYGNINIEVTE